MTAINVIDQSPLPDHRPVPDGLKTPRAAASHLQRNLCAGHCFFLTLPTYSIILFPYINHELKICIDFLQSFSPSQLCPLHCPEGPVSAHKELGAACHLLPGMQLVSDRLIRILAVNWQIWRGPKPSNRHLIAKYTAYHRAETGDGL